MEFVHSYIANRLAAHVSHNAATLSLSQVKQSFHDTKKIIKPKNKKEPIVLEPSRRSLRLRGCTPEGTPRPPPPPPTISATISATDSFSKPRKPSGPLPMEHLDKDDEGLEREFRASLMKSLQSGTPMNKWVGLVDQTDETASRYVRSINGFLLTNVIRAEEY